MLVLTRKVGEKIIVGGNITITVTQIDGSRMSLGIDAPEDVPILRAELLPPDDTAKQGTESPQPTL